MAFRSSVLLLRAPEVQSGPCGGPVLQALMTLPCEEDVSAPAHHLSQTLTLLPFFICLSHGNFRLPCFCLQRGGRHEV